MPSGWSAVGGQTQSAYVRGGLDSNDSKDGHSVGPPLHSVNDFSCLLTNSQSPSGSSSMIFNQKSGHDNQDMLKSSYELNISSEEYQANFDHMRHIGRDRGIDQILDKYGVDVLMGQIDSTMMSYAASAGKPILETVLVRN